MLALLGTAMSVECAPRIPANDSTVLETVPAAGAMRRLEPLRERLRKQPRDEAAATALAEGYLQIGRATADPRFISYAQSTVAPWVSAGNASPRMLVLAATAFQNLHRFDAALELIDRALVVESQDPQALLTRATILQVQGRFGEARNVCRSLIQAAGQLIAVTCLTSVNSLTGNLSTSYRALQAVFTDDARLPTELRTWVQGQLGEMAVRAGKPREAEGYFQAALRANPADLYIKAAYSDLLLSERRSADVVRLLAENEAQDNLLLRLAIAGKQQRSAAGERWGALFQARFEAARRDGDFTHLREQARYFLDVRSDARRSLELAKQNWHVQHEPDDIRIYARAARAVSASTPDRTVFDWIQTNRYEDATLGRVAPPASPSGGT